VGEGDLFWSRCCLGGGSVLGSEAGAKVNVWYCQIAEFALVLAPENDFNERKR
jgi:hypothetical protein